MVVTPVMWQGSVPAIDVQLTAGDRPCPSCGHRTGRFGGHPQCRDLNGRQAAVSRLRRRGSFGGSFGGSLVGSFVGRVWCTSRYARSLDALARYVAVLGQTDRWGMNAVNVGTGHVTYIPRYRGFHRPTDTDALDEEYRQIATGISRGLLAAGYTVQEEF